MGIDVSKHLEEMFREKLREGDYASADQLLSEALTSLEQQRVRKREESIRAALESYLLHDIDPGPPEGLSPEEWDERRDDMTARVRAEIAEARAQVDRGESVDGEAFFDELDAELAAEEQRLGGE